MKLGLRNDEVRLVGHAPEWKEEFLKVKNCLIGHTQLEEYRVEHIGSTAIKDMTAKPIIDILVGIESIIDIDKSIYKSFYKAGFLRLKVERPNEIILAKFTDETYEVKTHYIHLVDYQGKLWNELIFFRNYLNSNRAARQQYSDIKKDYLKNSSTGINAYTHHKEAFVKSITNKGGMSH